MLLTMSSTAHTILQSSGFMGYNPHNFPNGVLFHQYLQGKELKFLLLLVRQILTQCLLSSFALMSGWAVDRFELHHL